MDSEVYKTSPKAITMWYYKHKNIGNRILYNLEKFMINK